MPPCSAVRRRYRSHLRARLVGNRHGESLEASSQRKVPHCHQDVRGIRPFARESDSHVSPLVPLSEAEQDFLQDVAERMKDSQNIPCTDCKYCMPCPYGIDIPANFLHYNKCVNHGYVSKSHLDANYEEARRAFLIGYDRRVPKLSQASHCIGCGQCASQCPQGIDIPSQMRMIDDYVERLRSCSDFIPVFSQ